MSSTSIDVVFGRRHRRMFLTQVVSQISATTFELLKTVINSDKGCSFIMIGQLNAKRDASVAVCGVTVSARRDGDHVDSAPAPADTGRLAMGWFNDTAHLTDPPAPPAARPAAYHIGR
ncbi:hypothetical protein EVAR_39192_1 [Eumeta japonica]|uniref:Uncharacterized protein n=1 Tax=Eumeta variegata TaxID=151549 RepID=A0A4C1VQ20_EUMVA|nr:hypothetical protein EVAR_39192_1 [Eumeta japonica]